MDVLETLMKANDDVEMTRWIIHMAHDRKLLAPKQFGFSALQLNECGRMVGGWLKSRLSTSSVSRGNLLP